MPTNKRTTTWIVAAVIAGLMAMLLGPFAFLGLTAAMLPAVLGGGCQAISVDGNGVGRGGTGYIVTSYNIRGAQLSAASAGMAKHAGDYKWSKRGPVVARFLANIDADLIGLQEANKPPGSGADQLTVIAKALPGHRWLYANMAIPIGYRASAFTLVDRGVVRLNWKGKGGATSDRRAVWAKLKATSDGTTVLFVNLHSQHMQLKAQARARSAGWSRLVVALQRINPDNELPTIMVGDFNAMNNETRPVFNDHLIKLGKAGFVEAGATATTVAPIAGVNSYNAFGDTIGGRWYYKSINRSTAGNHIDYVWTAGEAQATTWQIYTGPAATWKPIKGQQVPFADFIPSDHWPVIAKVTVGATETGSESDPQLALTNNPATLGGFGLPEWGQPRQQSLQNPILPIPAGIKRLYVAAATRYGLPWALLAGIGMAETRHGANNNTSSAGAQGLMQFMPATFAAYGVDGDADGVKNIRSDADSIHSAANYLVASGVKNGHQGVLDALWAYNRSVSYRNDVLFYAWAYLRAGGLETDAGAAACTGAGGPLNSTATGQWADVINFAVGLVGKYPYSWGGGTLTGPSGGFGQGAGIVGFDCSSFVRYVVYQKAGVVLPRTSRAQASFLQARGVVTRTNDWRDLQAGDIVFYSRGNSVGSIYHVAIVSKAGWIIEEPGGGRHVQHNQLANRMPRDIWGYARLDLASLKSNSD